MMIDINYKWSILIAFLTGTLSILFWHYRKLLFGAKTRKTWTVEVEEERPERGHGKPRRHFAHPQDFVTTIDPNVHTIYEAMKYSSQKYQDVNCLGKRNILKTHQEEIELEDKDEQGNPKKKTWIYYELSPYEWISYRQTFGKILDLGKSLRAIGLTKENYFGFYLDSCPEWMMTAQACFTQSITGVTVYANLGEEALIHALNECNVKNLLTDAKLFSTFIRIAPKCNQEFENIIYIGEPSQEDIDAIKEKGINILSFEEFENKGKEVDYEPSPPSADDTALIMYTSGTTGLPKGVYLSHKNLLATSAGALEIFPFQRGDIYIGYLPLAHVLELVIEIALLIAGVSIGYANTRTLTDASIKNCKNDFQELRPTLAAGVPAIWQRIEKAISRNVQKSTFTNFIFQLSLKIKKKMIRANMKTPLLDSLVFRKTKEQFGGRLRTVLSGGAPLDSSLHDFLRCVVSCPVLQGYGLTETSGANCLLPLEKPAVNNVGVPLPSCEIKLVDVPEMNYYVDNRPKPQGEIWIRGPSVSKGYFNNEKKTKEEFKNGWFITGDIGEWNKDGTLSIIDRKKNLIKLSGGEYIALEQLESKYVSSPYVDNLCIYGDSTKDYLVSIILPSEPTVTEWAKQHNIKHNIEELCENSDLKKEIKRSLDKIASENGFKNFQKIHKFHLTADEWSPENGMTTAAHKIKRNKVKEKYDKEIRAMYGEERPSRESAH